MKPNVIHSIRINTDVGSIYIQVPEIKVQKELSFRLLDGNILIYNQLLIAQQENV
jgi:hypothetical protein